MVDISLYIPDMAEPITITCKVVHTKTYNVPEEEQGIGVKFIDIDDESRLKLIDFIRNQSDCH
jgi:Tfp pilus assembly protein PilZ